MSNDSTQTLVGLRASGLAVGGVDSAATGTSRVSLQAVTAIGATAVVAAVSLATLRAITGAGTGLPLAAPVMELIRASGTAVTGSVGRSPAPVFAPYIQASGAVAMTGRSSVTLELIQALKVLGAGLRGSIGGSAATREYIVASGAGSFPVTGSSRQTLQMPQAVGQGFISTGATFAAVVLQTQLQGITTYTNFPFNSFARLNGANLAAGDGGLFLMGMGAPDDNGNAIQAAARFGITDFNSAFRKRVERVYLGYRSTYDMVLRVYVNDMQVRDYRVPGNLSTGIHGTHVKLGRGVEARYWQFEIRNQAGAGFQLNTVEVRPVKLERRVGGSDA